MAQIQYRKDKAARLEKERAWWAEYYRKNPQSVSRMCGTCGGNRLISKENPNRNSATERYVYRKEFDGSYTYQGKSYESILVVCPACKGEGWIREYPDKAR